MIAANSTAIATATPTPTPIPAFAPVGSPDARPSDCAAALCDDSFALGADPIIEIAVGLLLLSTYVVDVAVPALDRGTADDDDDSAFAEVDVGKIGADAGVKEDKSTTSHLTSIRGRAAANVLVCVSVPRMNGALIGELHQSAAKASHPLQDVSTTL